MLMQSQILSFGKELTQKGHTLEAFLSDSVSTGPSLKEESIGHSYKNMMCL